MIKIKRGVVVANLHCDHIMEPAEEGSRIYEEEGFGDFWIVSGIEGNHVEDSYHYGKSNIGEKPGQGVDSGYPPGGEPCVKQAYQRLKEMLPDWIVLREDEKKEENGGHFHFQTK